MENSNTNVLQWGENWRSRGIGLFHFFCFIGLLILFGAGIGIAIYFAMHGHMPPFGQHGAPKPPADISGNLFPELGQALGALLATLVMALATGHKFTRYGYGGRNRVRNFLIGLVAGIAFLGIILLIMQGAGAATLGMPSFDPSKLVYFASIYGVLFVAVAIFEETSMRGYALVELVRAISFWPAAILLGVLFGAAHLGNGASEGYVGAATAGLFGVAMAYSFLKTGSLWYALGLHAGWDYAESYIFGTSDSGLPPLKGCIFHPTFHGPAWLTGGTVGPEGSVLVFGALAAIVILAWLIREPT